MSIINLVKMLVVLLTIHIVKAIPIENFKNHRIINRNFTAKVNQSVKEKLVPEMPQKNSMTQQLSWIQHMRLMRQWLKECEHSSSSSSSASTTPINAVSPMSSSEAHHRQFLLSASPSSSSSSLTTWHCLKNTGLRLFDSITARDSIPLWNGVRLVRLSDKNNRTQSDNTHSWQRTDLQYLTWFDKIALSTTRMLTTHMLEVNLKELTDSFVQRLEERDSSSSFKANDHIGTARGRRHRYNMMITMMFSITALGSVLVPMGFQLLSVVSGKALLLAKMALLLASINGLKRVANSGIHYGLYHVPGEHYGGYYDRGDVHHPRNVQGLNVAAAAAAPMDGPIEFGINI